MPNEKENSTLQKLINRKYKKIAALQEDQKVNNAVYEARLLMLTTDIAELEQELNSQNK